MLTDFTARGSQRWLQIAVNRAPETLNAPLREALALGADDAIDWRSPREDDGFLEYRDGTFLDRLCCEPLSVRTLEAFWPARGPMWDGLARTSRGDLLIVEAKAHVPEIISGGTRATGDGRARIEAALRETQRALAPKADAVDWSKTFYQYANGLAHLYLLREVNRVPAHLVYVYFLNAADVNGPSERAEWIGAIKVVEGYLGLGAHRLSRYIHKVFVDVADLPHVEPHEVPITAGRISSVTLDSDPLR
jgi:hypothetical protein